MRSLYLVYLLSAVACTNPDAPALRAPPPPPRVSMELPEGMLVHGVFPGGRSGWEDDITDGDIQTYVDTVQHEVAWVYVSHNWFHGHAFPTELVQTIRNRGSVPWLRLMMRSGVDTVRGPDPEYPLERIRAGDFDEDLRAWGEAAGQIDGPLIVEWGTEMNGDWFSWNARYHGRTAGAALFAETYQHIVTTVADGGADNLTWVFHVNDGGSSDRSWNDIAAYDPGPEVCPWVAVSVYGPQTPEEPNWWTFRESLDATWPHLESVANGRPILLAEFGVTAGASGRPADWAEAALNDLFDARWPALRGFSWWNETWENDDDPSHDSEMRVAEIPGMPAVFQNALSRGVIERPTFTSP